MSRNSAREMSDISREGHECYLISIPGCLVVASVTKYTKIRTAWVGPKSFLQHSHQSQGQLVYSEKQQQCLTMLCAVVYSSSDLGALRATPCFEKIKSRLCFVVCECFAVHVAVAWEFASCGSCVRNGSEKTRINGTVAKPDVRVVPKTSKNTVLYSQFCWKKLTVSVFEDVGVIVRKSHVNRTRHMI